MRRLGTAQLAVLRSVKADRDPVDGLDYPIRCRREEVARKLLTKGLLRLLAHNHPHVIAGGCQWILTDTGRAALEATERTKTP